MAVTIDNSGITYSDGTKQGSGPSAAADYGQLISITVFTSSGTYTAPANCRALLVKVQGGGGGQAFLATAGGQNPAGLSKVLELIEHQNVQPLIHQHCKYLKIHLLVNRNIFLF